MKQENIGLLKYYICIIFVKCYISLNIKVISQYQFVCTCLSSAHTPTCKLVGVWALEKLVLSKTGLRNYIYAAFSCYYCIDGNSFTY